MLSRFPLYVFKWCMYMRTFWRSFACINVCCYGNTWLLAYHFRWSWSVQIVGGKGWDANVVFCGERTLLVRVVTQKDDDSSTKCNSFSSDDSLHLIAWTCVFSQTSKGGSDLGIIHHHLLQPTHGFMVCSFDVSMLPIVMITSLSSSDTCIAGHYQSID